MKKEKGSILILTVIAVLILSIMAAGLLNVGTTEIYTTQNYQMNKSAYYETVTGVEEIRNLIYNAPNAEAVTSIVKSTYDTEVAEGGMKRAYMTGTLKDREAGGSYGIGVPVTKFEGFDPPPLPGISLGSISSVSPVIWKVNITGEVNIGKRKAYAEIASGVYSVLTVSY